jgi:hypothetical protein
MPSQTRSRLTVTYLDERGLEKRTLISVSRAVIERYRNGLFYLPKMGPVSYCLMRGHLSCNELAREFAIEFQRQNHPHILLDDLCSYSIFMNPGKTKCKNFF